MAFTVRDYQDLIRLLREHPEWRAELRREILDEEFLQLPELVRQNSSDIQRLTENVDQLVNQMRQVHIDLAELRGESLERWYRDHPAVLAKVRRFRKIHVPEMGELGLLDDAIDAGMLTQAEIDALYDLDLIVSGREGRGTESHDALLAVEISNKIDTHDVERSIARAELLRRAGYVVHPVVAGRSIAPGAERLAARANVLIVLRREDRDSQNAS